MYENVVENSQHCEKVGAVPRLGKTLWSRVTNFFGLEKKFKQFFLIQQYSPLPCNNVETSTKWKFKSFNYSSFGAKTISNVNNTFGAWIIQFFYVKIAIIDGRKQKVIPNVWTVMKIKTTGLWVCYSPWKEHISLSFGAKLGCIWVLHNKYAIGPTFMIALMFSFCWNCCKIWFHQQKFWEISSFQMVHWDLWNHLQGHGKSPQINFVKLK